MRSVSLFFFVVALVSCGRDEEQINCNDLLPAGEAPYSAVAAIVTNVNDPRNCASCHNSATPIYDIDLETPEGAYHDLAKRMNRIYPQIASGEMPDNGQSWSSNDLRLLRTWYCQGAAP